MHAAASKSMLGRMGVSPVRHPQKAALTQTSTLQGGHALPKYGIAIYMESGSQYMYILQQA